MPRPQAWSYSLNSSTELALLRQTLADPSILPRLAPHLRPEGFEVPELKTAFVAALGYFHRHGMCPTGTSILQEVREQITEGKMTYSDMEATADLLDRVATVQPIDSSYALELILQKEREDAMFRALEDGVLLHSKGKLDEIVDVIEQANSVGRVDMTMGTDFARTLDARSNERARYQQPRRWGTGIAELDDIIEGGLSQENPMGLVLGAAKGGKSMFLDQVSLTTIAAGGYVVFFSLEMGEAEVIRRHDAAVAFTPLNEIYPKAAYVREKVQEWLLRARGGLHVKKMPQGEATSCRDLDAYLQQLRVVHGVRPDMIIVDYVDEMSANNPARYDRRHEELVSIMRELRALGDKHKCPLWTATQVNKEGLEEKTPNLSNIAGAYAKAWVADLIVAICRTAEERADNRVRFFVAGSRFSADGVQTSSLPSAYNCGRIVVGAAYTAQAA